MHQLQLPLFSLFLVFKHIGRLTPNRVMFQRARVSISVYGRVQGVFFRSETQKKAEELGIFGWVRNLPDGKVEILAEGEEGKLEKLIKWAEEGPDSARVDNLEINRQKYSGEFKDFKIRY